MLGAIVPGIFIACGIGMLTVEWFPHNLLIAQICFFAAAALCVIKFIGHAIESDGSKRSRFIFAFVLCVIVLVLAIVVVGYVQEHKNPALTGNPAVQAAHLLFVYMGRPWPQRILYVVLGIVLMLLFQALIIAMSAVIAQSKRKVNADKGFLDYRMQAEEAMTELPLAMASITKIILQAGKSTESQTVRVQSVSNSSARIQRRVIGRGARMLNYYSLQIDAKCARLEKIGNSLTEGQLGWFTWVKSQGNYNTELLALRQQMLIFSDTMGETIKSSNEYLDTIQSMRGVSQDLNAAVDAYAGSIRRVRDINMKILNSCLNTLNMLQDENC
ncbi:MAG: hypothetical protein ACYCO5_12055 [Acidobacteriaceae bacterium]